MFIPIIYSFRSFSVCSLVLVSCISFSFYSFVLILDGFHFFFSTSTLLSFQFLMNTLGVPDTSDDSFCEGSVHFFFSGPADLPCRSGRQILPSRISSVDDPSLFPDDSTFPSVVGFSYLSVVWEMTLRRMD